MKRIKNGVLKKDKKLIHILLNKLKVFERKNKIPGDGKK